MSVSPREEEHDTQLWPHKLGNGLSLRRVAPHRPSLDIGEVGAELRAAHFPNLPVADEDPGDTDHVDEEASVHPGASSTVDRIEDVLAAGASAGWPLDAAEPDRA